MASLIVDEKGKQVADFLLVTDPKDGAPYLVPVDPADLTGCDSCG